MQVTRVRFPVKAGGSSKGKGGDDGYCLHNSLPNLTKGVKTGTRRSKEVNVVSHIS